MSKYSTSLPQPLRGIVPPLITPLRHSQALDEQGLYKLIEHVLRGGVHGIFALGSTGESPSLSMELRRAVITEICAAVSGRVPVLVNVSETALAHSVQLAEHAARTGASAVAIAPPGYFPLSQNHLRYFVQKFAENCPLPVFLYNVPQYVHNELAPGTVRELSYSPNVIGLKNSNGSLEYVADVRAAVAHRPEFAVLVGNEEKLLPALLCGAHGGVCGGANMFPELYVQLFDSVAGGRVSEAAPLHKRIVQLAQAVYTVGPPESSYLRGLKCALSILHGLEDVLAEPLERFDVKERNELQGRLSQVLETVQP